MNEIYQRKSIAVDETTITDIDEAKGIVTGYFSKFGNVDSDGDVIMPGAFSKTLKDNYRRIKHLYQHDPWRPLSATKNGNLRLAEDTIGLGFVSTISQTSYGKDAIRLHVDGVIDENSIGFKTIRSQAKKDYNEITEVMLWEGSAVTWGANGDARTTDVKSEIKPDLIIKKMDTVTKAIRNGKYENEEIFDSLELYFKQLQQIIIDLTKTSTHAAEEAPAPDLTGNESLTIEELKSIHQIFKS